MINFLVISSGDGCAGVGGKAHVAIGENAEQLAACCRPPPPGLRKSFFPHQAQGVGQCRRGRNRIGVDHHAGDVALDHGHLLGLGLGGEVAMDDADAAGLEPWRWQAALR